MAGCNWEYNHVQHTEHYVMQLIAVTRCITVVLRIRNHIKAHDDDVTGLHIFYVSEVVHTRNPS